MERAVPVGIGSAEGRGRRIPPPTPRVALTIAAAAVVGVVLLLAAGAVKPFVLGVVLVYLLAPLVERVAAAGVPRGLSVLLVFAVVIAVVAVVGAFALSPLITQVRLFVSDLPEIVADLRVALEDFYRGLNLSAEVREEVDRLLGDAGAGLGGIDLGGLVSPLVSSIVGVVGTATAYAILPAWLFFVLKDRLRLADALERSLPPGWRADVFALFALANRVFGNWVRGQLILGAVVGIFSYVGLMLLSAFVDPVFGRYAVLLALIAGLLELIPFIGPIIAAVPAVLIGLTVGPGGFLAALLLYLAIQQVENNLLVPKIQGDAVELHPSIVLVALIVGTAIGGILGAIVSLPIAAAARDMYRYGFHRVGDPPASVEESLARISPALPASLRRSVLDAGATPPATPPGPAGEAGVDGGPPPASEAPA